MVRCKQKWTTKKDNEQRKGFVPGGSKIMAENRIFTPV